MTVNFYNTNLAEWEPMVEPWNCVVEYRRNPTTDEQNPYMTELIVSSIEFGKDANRSIEQLQNILNINVSKSMLNTILNTSKAWQEGLKNDVVVSQKFDPFMLRNQTGVKIKFLKESKNEIEVGPGEEIGFSYTETQTRATKIAWKKELLIYLTIPELSAQSINIRRVGKTLLSNKQGTTFAIVDVEQLEGRKIITVRSNVRVLNETTVSWDLALHTDTGLVSYGTIGMLLFVGLFTWNSTCKQYGYSNCRF